MNKKWSILAENLIRQNSEKSDKEIVELLKKCGIMVNISSLAKKRLRLGIKKKLGRKFGSKNISKEKKENKENNYFYDIVGQNHGRIIKAENTEKLKEYPNKG
jgi:arginine repressor